MPNSTNETFEFLKSRRSYSLPTLSAPGPGRSATRELLEIASRVPDHGALVPWRFVVPGTDTMAQLAMTAERIGGQNGVDPDKLAKSLRQFRNSPRLVVVIASPKSSEKIPEIEQTLTAGAVCLSLVNASLAAGWGAVWLTNWLAHDRTFAAPAFGLQPHEWVAGLIHIGTPGTPPVERSRPDCDAITTWLA